MHAIISFPKQLLAKHGKAGFYSGRIAQAVVDCVQSRGGVLTLADLAKHTSTHDQPIKTCYRGIDVWEMPPNGQGITALLALNILEGFDIKSEPLWKLLLVSGHSWYQARKCHILPSLELYPIYIAQGKEIKNERH